MKKVISILAVIMFAACSDVNVKNTPLDVNVKNDKPIKVELESNGSGTSGKNYFSYSLEPIAGTDFFRMVLGTKIVLTYTNGTSIDYYPNKEVTKDEIIKGTVKAAQTFEASVLKTNELVFEKGSTVLIHTDKQVVYTCGFGADNSLDIKIQKGND